MELSVDLNSGLDVKVFGLGSCDDFVRKEV